tara:strand:+ start:75 stop:449 length:375 start_codon:yes stop_codon:yes gene_type:complete
MKFLNIFNKNKEVVTEEQDEAPIAAVTYTIDPEGEMYIDINMEDFNDSSIEGLAQLLAMISTVKCQLITMEMIKNSFISEDRTSEYLKLVTAVVEHTSEMVETAKRENNNTEDNVPYIKPSDML